MAAGAPPRFSGGLRCPPLSSSCLSRYADRALLSTVAFATAPIGAAVAISNAQTRERQKLKDLFEDARERCLTDPVDGVSFTEADFLAALDKYDCNTDVGTKVSVLAPFCDAIL